MWTKDGVARIIIARPSRYKCSPPANANSLELISDDPADLALSSRLSISDDPAPTVHRAWAPVFRHMHKRARSLGTGAAACCGNRDRLLAKVRITVETAAVYIRTADHYYETQPGGAINQSLMKPRESVLAVLWLPSARRKNKNKNENTTKNNISY